MYGMFNVGECTFRSVSIEDKETGRSFKIDGIQDAVLEMPLWSAEAELPISVSGHIPTEATFEAKTKWDQDVLDAILYNPLVYKSSEFDMKVKGIVQVRRHRKKRINKKWAKRYGFREGLVFAGRFRLAEYNTRDGKFNFEKGMVIELMGLFLIWLVKTGITIFWILDICNMPFMEMFDTTYPLNTLFWLLVWLLCGGETVIERKK